MKELVNLQTPIAISKPQEFTGMLLTTWSISKEEVQEVLTAYRKMGLADIVPSEFDRLFNDTQSLLYEKITGGSTHLVGAGGVHINIDKSKALDIIQKPEGYNAFVESVANFAEVCQKANRVGERAASSYQKSEISKYFILTESGDIDFTNTLKLRIEEADNTYITTNRGEAVHNFLTAVSEKFFELELDKYFPRTGMPQTTSEGINNRLTGELMGDLIADHMRELNYETKQYKPRFTGGHSAYYQCDSQTYKPGL